MLAGGAVIGSGALHGAGQRQRASGDDGRRLRRTHNRHAVLRALVELFEQGLYQPSAAEIAERAGLSPRSLFRYFDDIDDLSRAAIDHEMDRVKPLLELRVDPEDSTAVKIEAVVEARVRLFEALGHTARAARVAAHRNPVVAARMREARSFRRHQIRRLFARELDGDRAVLLPALDALCEFETYDLLRVDQGLSRSKTAAGLVAALHALLGDPSRGAA